MTGRIFFSDFIEEDLKDICAYIAERNSGAAHRTILEILDKFRILSQNKLLGTSRSTLWLVYGSSRLAATKFSISRPKQALRFIAFCTVRAILYKYSTKLLIN